MRCDELHVLLDRTLDGGLTDIQRAQMKEHLRSCPSCRMGEQLLSDSRTLDEDIEVPAAFSEGWRRAVRAEEAVKPAKQLSVLLRYLSVAAALILVVGGTLLAGEQRRNRAAPATAPAPMAVREDAGASGYSANESDQAAQGAADEAADAMTVLRAAPMPKSQPQIARSVEFTIQTAGYDGDRAALGLLLDGLGAASEREIQSVSDSGLRSTDLVVRVSQEDLDALTQGLQSLGTSRTESISTEDLTREFADAQLRLQAAQGAEGEGDTASASLKLQALESRALKPTVTITLTETPAASLGGRIRQGLRAAWGWAAPIAGDFLVFLAVALPALAVLALAAVIITRIYKRRKHP